MPLAFDLDPELRESLPPGGERFLDGLAAALDPDRVRAVLLFGSVVSAEATDVSDVDLLVVLEDDATRSEAETVRTRCRELSREHLPASSERNTLESTVDRETGMFQSGFVAFAGDVRDGAFHAVFDTSRAAYLLAPWRTVLASVFDSAVPVYGRPISPEWDRIGRPDDRRFRELCRSFATALLLSVAQLPYALASPRSMRYAMEAHKWTLYNCAFHLAGGPTTLAGAIEAAPDVASLDDRLVSLREEPRFEVSYLLSVPAYVTVVHVLTAATLVRR